MKHSTGSSDGKPKLYEVGDSTSRNPRYAWAGSADPRAVMESRCEACQTLWIEPADTIDIEIDPTLPGGRVWPDVLGIGSGYFGLYVSEAIKNDWDEEGIDYGRCFPAVVKKYPRRLKEPPPTYYAVLAHSGAVIDPEASEWIVKRYCEKCHLHSLDAKSNLNKYVFVPGSWDGSDLFHPFGEPHRFFCTQRVVDIASDRRRTNFRFIDIEEDYETAYAGIPYLDGKRG